MTRFLIVSEILLSIAFFGLAYLWVYNLEPSNPIVPFVCCVLCGGLIVNAWQRLGDALESGE